MSENKNEQKIYSPVFNWTHQLIFFSPAFFLTFFFYAEIGFKISFIPFFIVWIAVFVIKKLLYQYTVFEIKKDSISVKRDWITFSEKKLFYDSIREITINKGILQKCFGLGTIRIINNSAIPAGQDYGNNTGIRFYNIEDSKKVFDLIQEKLRSLKSSSSAILTKQS